MAGLSAADKGTGYPALTADQINMLIDSLVHAVADGKLAGDAQAAGELIGRLTSFYTRRWGLPPCLQRPA